MGFLGRLPLGGVLRRPIQTTCWTTGVAACFLSQPLCSADEWGYLDVRSTGGAIYGKLIDKDYKDPTTGESSIVIETESGGKIQMARSGVTWRAVNVAAIEYETKVENLADTADAHWEIVNWCLEQKSGKVVLKSQIEVHLLRIAELDPADDLAAKELQKAGWTKVDGRWHPEEQFFLANGYVQVGGRWIPQLQMKIDALNEEQNRLIGEKRSELVKWKRQFARKSMAELTAELVGIVDEVSIPLVEEYARAETDVATRRVYLEVIGGIPCGASQSALLHFLMEDPDPGIRDRALSLLLQPSFDSRADCNRALASQKLLQSLAHPKNDILQWGAFCLGELGQSNAILPLVNAVQTKHKQKNPYASDPNRMNVTNSNQGTSFNPGGGGGPQEIEKIITNAEVINALKKLTGADAGTSVAQWQQWYLDNYTLGSMTVTGDY